MTELLTGRLELRRWREEDLEAYAAIMAKPEVRKYLGDGQPLDRASAWRQIAMLVGHREFRGFTQSAVIERATGRLIGRGGLWRPEGWPDLEVGWVLDPAAWGHGYARELGSASRDYAFDVLRAEHLISLIDPANAASIRVAEAIGSTLEGHHDVNGTHCACYGQAGPRSTP